MGYGSTFQLICVYNVYGNVCNFSNPSGTVVYTQTIGLGTSHGFSLTYINRQGIPSHYEIPLNRKHEQSQIKEEHVLFELYTVS